MPTKEKLKEAFWKITPYKIGRRRRQASSRIQIPLEGYAIVSQDKLRKTFKELIEINSFYPDDLKVQEYVLARCRHPKIKCVKDDFGNVIASLAGNKNKPAVMLNTHIDIPEDTPQVAYRETPEGIEGTGQTILGADPKTGLAVLLELALALADTDPKERAPIDFVFTRGEEQGLHGARELDMSKVRARTGLVVDEDGPASVVVHQAPGYIKFEGKFVGKTVHPREPQLGANALQMLAEAIVQVPLGFTDKTERVTWNLGVSRAGTAVNSVPGTAHFKAELRSFDDELLQSEAQRVYDTFAKVATKAGGSLDAELRTLHHSYALEPDDPLLVKMDTVFEQLEMTPTYIKTFGASDANVFNTRGIHCAPIGSGYYHAHQYIERADLQDMQNLAVFLDKFTRV